MKKNIVLIGFMGAGKSLASKELARRLKREAVATDALIERKEGRSITDIFKNSGEEYFRKVECEVVEKIAKREGLIIDCGGGAFLKEENILALKETGIVFYLQASPDEIYERIKGQRHRPLLEIEDPKGKIIELLEKRKPFYLQADYIVDTNGKTNQAVCDRIVELLSNE
ncbi:MAG: shikimate kinase [Candidatus Omnitrophota bacterium]